MKKYICLFLFSLILSSCSPLSYDYESVSITYPKFTEPDNKEFRYKVKKIVLNEELKKEVIDFYKFINEKSMKKVDVSKGVGFEKVDLYHMILNGEVNNFIYLPDEDFKYQDIIYFSKNTKNKDHSLYSCDISLFNDVKEKKNELTSKIELELKDIDRVYNKNDQF